MRRQRTTSGTRRGALSEKLEPRLLMATFDVTTNADSGAGSLRAAITAANQAAGADTITFHIPATNGIVPGLFPSTQLPEITGPTVVDATTQPQYAAAGHAVVQLAGFAAGAGASGFRLNNAGACVIRGFQINRWTLDGIRITGSTTAVIESNWIGPSPDGLGGFGNGVGVYTSSSGGTIGGAAAAARNVISGNRGEGVVIDGGRQNVVRFNYIGTTAAGGAAPAGAATLGNAAAGVSVRGATSTDAANVVDDNVISANAVGVSISGSAGNLLRRNTVGLNAGRSIRVANTGDGVLITGANAARNVVGGDPATGDVANVIAGNGGNGVSIDAGVNQTLVQGNKFWVRLDPPGQAIRISNNRSGVQIAGSQNRVIDNSIRYSEVNGIRAVGGTDNLLSGNAIRGTAQAIDLGGDGATPNDAGDADAGPNGLQNFPVLTSAISDGTKTVVTGTLNSRPGFDYRIEVFFVDRDPTDPPGFTFSAATTVTANASGNASFAVNLPPMAQGWSVAATATRLAAGSPGETSEVSAAVTVPEVLDPHGPRVLAVYVGGTAWNSVVSDYLENTGRGAHLYGYAVPGGPAQLATLPWANLNTVSIHFTEQVNVHRDDLVVSGKVGDDVATPGGYTIVGFTYDSPTHTATWTLRSPPRADRLRLELDADAAAGVTDLLGNPLDGEWTDGAKTFPSGNQTPGGDFVFGLNVLPGDADRSGSVNALDLALVRRALGSTLSPVAVPSAHYSVFADLDGDGHVGAVDLAIARNNQRRRLPALAALV